MGLKYTLQEYHPQRYVNTLQARTLETFLSHVARRLGVEFYLGYTFMNIETNSTYANAVIYEGNDDINIPPGIRIPFDILVGADGTKSTVRSGVGFTFERVPTFLRNDNLRVVPATNIEQLSIVVNFKPDPVTGICPTERVKDSKGIVSNELR